jgi:hypothetical protein
VSSAVSQYVALSEVKELGGDTSIDTAEEVK